MLEGHALGFRHRGAPPMFTEVAISVPAGTITGLSGPSGRGKSTLGRLLAGHLRPQVGTVRVDGAPLPAGLSPVQYVHQSPIHAVDPRWRIGRIVEEGWMPDAADRAALGVSRDWYDRFPHEISGGQLQRVALLRALAPGVRYLVADEITAMLDPIAQVDIWRALAARVADGLGILAISHDEALLERIAARSYRLDGALVAVTEPSSA